MKIALLGATGNVGSKILAELLGRGHNVTGIVRHPEKLKFHPQLTAKRGEITDEVGLSQILSGHDAVISSVRFLPSDPHILLRAVKKAGVNRILVVGGAGSLQVAPGVQLVDDPRFPKEYGDEALAGREFLNVLRSEEKLD
jgi:putative NADH-flavin reductase